MSEIRYILSCLLDTVIAMYVTLFVRIKITKEQKYDHNNSYRLHAGNRRENG